MRFFYFHYEKNQEFKEPSYLEVAFLLSFGKKIRSFVRKSEFAQRKKQNSLQLFFLKKTHDIKVISLMAC